MATEFWIFDLNEGDRHYCDSRDEAIEEWLNGLDTLPKTVTAHRFVTRTIDSKFREGLACGVQDYIIDELDDEFSEGAEESGAAYFTYDEDDRVHNIHARQLVDHICDVFFVWACDEVVPAEEVNVEAWVREHRPDWLEKKA